MSLPANGRSKFVSENLLRDRNLDENDSQFWVRKKTGFAIGECFVAPTASDLVLNLPMKRLGLLCARGERARYAVSFGGGWVSTFFAGRLGGPGGTVRGTRAAVAESVDAQR